MFYGCDSDGYDSDCGFGGGALGRLGFDPFDDFLDDDFDFAGPLREFRNRPKLGSSFKKTKPKGKTEEEKKVAKQLKEYIEKQPG